MTSLIIAGVVLILMVTGLYLASHRLLFKPEKFSAPYSPRFSSDISCEDVYFTCQDGTQLHGWFCSRPEFVSTMLICHGNRGCIRGREATVDFYAAFGINVLLFDYRGYGLSDGRPTESGTYQDVAAAWSWLREHKSFPAHTIIVHGRSLGGAVAANLLATLPQEERPGAAIIESTFTSIARLASELYPFAGRLISLFIRFDTQTKIGLIRSPLLLVHSREDELIGIHHGKALLDSAPEGTCWLEISGVHRNGFVTSQAVYRPAVTRFLQENSLTLIPLAGRSEAQGVQRSS